MRKIIILIIILIIIFSTNSVWAKFPNELPGPEVMPDSPFYFLKIWYEKIITFISFGDVKKAERYSKLAERRLYEAEKMAEKGKDKLVQKLLEEYEKNLSKALSRVEEIKKQAEETAKQKIKEKINQVLERVSESTLKNQEVLLRVYGLVPNEAKTSIEKVIEATKKGYQQATEAVSGIKKEKLMERAEEIKNKAQKIIKDWQEIFGK